VTSTASPRQQTVAQEVPTSGDNPLYRRTFVGRENEVRQLQQAFDAALSGQGGLVMVVGEPGIGKTALCEQLATYVALRGGKALVGHCYEEGSLSLPYLAFVEAMRSYVLAREPEGLSEKAENLSCVQRHDEWDFSLYTRVEVSKAQVYRQMTLFRRLLMILILAILPIGILIMLFVQRRIARPIAILSQASKRISEGELGVTVPMRGSDELGQLGVAFSSMSTQIRHLVDTVYKEQLALKDARIEAMQARVNPHFLNNALELITWQARLDGSEAVTAMVEALSVLLNASLDRGDHRLATIAQELEVADAYFYFIRLRFGDRLTLWKDADPQLNPMTVPRLVIQTLLENAVEHGIAPAGGGAIHLKVFRDECNLHVEVVNSGRRLTPEDREKIRRLLSDEGAEGHVGIRNVSLRLRLIYGEKASLTISEDARTHDTMASILIPINADSNSPELTQGERGPQPPIE
jgi:sensor histidine kinase YesM